MTQPYFQEPLLHFSGTIRSHLSPSALIASDEVFFDIRKHSPHCKVQESQLTQCKTIQPNNNSQHTDGMAMVTLDPICIISYFFTFSTCTFHLRAEETCSAKQLCKQEKKQYKGQKETAWVQEWGVLSKRERVHNDSLRAVNYAWIRHISDKLATSDLFFTISMAAHHAIQAQPSPFSPCSSS